MKRFVSALVLIGIVTGLYAVTAHPATAQAPADPLDKTAIVGDSITRGYGATSYSKSYAGLLDTTFNAQGRDVQTFAVDGATALRWLNCPPFPTKTGCEYPKFLEHSQYTNLKDYKPTAVLIALGANELVISRSPTTYATQMVQLAQRIYSVVPAGTSIAFVFYYDLGGYGAQLPAPGTMCDMPGGQCGTSPRPAWSQYRDALRAVAAPNGISFIDISNMPLTKDVDFYVDKAHLDDSGHAIFYKSLNDFLQAAVPAPTGV